MTTTALDRMRCSCGGFIELVLTVHDDGTETFGPECLECGAEFSDPNEEVQITAEGELAFVPRVN